MSQRYSTSARIPLFSVANLNLSAGVDRWRQRSMSLSAQPSVQTGLNGPLAGASITRTKPGSNAGAYLQGQFGMWDALFLTYGVRAEWSPDYGDKAKVLPGRYGLSYVLPLGPITTKFRGSYGRSTRPPLPDQKERLPETFQPRLDAYGAFDLRLANPLLEPEHQQGGEGGIELYFGSRGSLVVTRYNQTVSNLIVNFRPIDSVRTLTQMPTNNALGCVPAADGYCYFTQTQWVNIASIRNQGWEVQGSLNVGPFTANGTYSWTKSRSLGLTPRFSTTLLGSARALYVRGRSFPMTEHTSAVGLTYAHARNRVGVNLNWIGKFHGSLNDKYYLVLTDALRLRANDALRFSGLPTGWVSINPSYAMADLNAARQLSSRIDVRLSVHNLSNFYQNDLRSIYPVAGRRSNIGINLNL